jgi:leucyl-tRNA synthetase
MAPVVPHLAEEIYHHYNGGGDEVSKLPSIFTIKWQPLVSDACLYSYFNNLLDLGKRTQAGKTSMLNWIWLNYYDCVVLFYLC